MSGGFARSLDEPNQTGLYNARVHPSAACFKRLVCIACGCRSHQQCMSIICNVVDKMMHHLIDRCTGNIYENYGVDRLTENERANRG